MADAPRISWFTTLGWACYLACSWTWCIGMFLPVLLIRDYGAWGFVVFAVPNVVGAAAMGWVLRRPGASATIVAHHAAAVRVFAAVTVTFQVFFYGWFVFGTSVAGSTSLGPHVWAVLVIGALCRAYRADRATLIACASVLAVSLGCALWALARGWVQISVPTAGPGGAARAGVVWLAPVCAFGFALCPYLDPSFHHARQSTAPRSGTAAFALGFTALFTPMIVFSMLYTPHVLDVMGARAAVDGPAPRVFESALTTLILLHMAGQLASTWMLHRVSVTGTGRIVSPAGDFNAARGFDWALMGAAVAVVATVWPGYAGFSGGEVVYRLFMAFYGLVFPAYVWLCMIPTPDSHSGIDRPAGRRKLVVWGVTVVLAAPAYWMGFIEREEWWLALGLLIVLAARLFIPGGPGVGRLHAATAGDSI